MLETESFDIERVRADFPILGRKVHGKRLVYLDNAATTQKPKQVIDALVDYYSRYNSNVHRSVHRLGEEATEAYENSRKKVAGFVGTPPDQLVFTRGTTEATNLVRFAWGERHVKSGDTLVATLMEHHSNIVPWQLLAKHKGATLKFVGLQKDGTLDMGSFEDLLKESPSLVAVTHCSNVLGTINDVAEICAKSKKAGATTLVDGAQAVPHMPVDISSIGCDFYAFSVAGDTPVLVNYGEGKRLIPIRDAVKLYNSGTSLRVLTLNEAGEAQFQPVTGALSHRDTLYEIRYENSALPILATAYHSVYVWRNGDIHAEEVSHLKSGDYLVTLNKQRAALLDVKPEIEFTYTHDRNVVTETIQITPGLMRLLGYYLAEGSANPADYKVTLTFSQCEDAYIHDSRKLIEELESTQYYAMAAGVINKFGQGQQTVLATNAGVSRKTVSKYLAADGRVGLARVHNITSHLYFNRKNHTANVSFNSKKWHEFFSKLCGTRASKHLPDFVWDLNKELVVELLRGYLGGDASKNERYRLKVKSVSKRMITEFSWLMKLHGFSNTLGFAKSRNPKWHDQYSLVIQRSALVGFKDFYRRNVKTDSSKDSLLCVDGLREAYKLSGAKYDYQVSSTIRGEAKRTTRDSVLRVVEWIESTRSKPITGNVQRILNRYRELAKGDIGLVKVRSIRSVGKRVVYDVSVQGTERFFGGYYPVLLHNSGHKMLGPTGIGGLVGRKTLLEEMDPFHGGGEMIREVFPDHSTWNDVPYKFEAGTVNIADTIGLGAAVDYLNSIGMERVRKHELDLLKYALDTLPKVKGFQYYGPKDVTRRGGVVSFNLADVHPHDLATILDEEGVEIRSGHHCAQLLMRWLDVSATSRASFYVYNSYDDIDALGAGLEKARSIFKL